MLGGRLCTRKRPLPLADYTSVPGQEPTLIITLPLRSLASYADPKETLVYLDRDGMLQRTELMFEKLDFSFERQLAVLFCRS